MKKKVLHFLLPVGKKKMMKPKVSPHHHSAVHLTLKYTAHRLNRKISAMYGNCSIFSVFHNLQFEAMLGTHTCKIVISDKAEGC